jgi:hypothetical protein
MVVPSFIVIVYSEISYTKYRNRNRPSIPLRKKIAFFFLSLFCFINGIFLCDESPSLIFLGFSWPITTVSVSPHIFCMP